MEIVQKIETTYMGMRVQKNMDGNRSTHFYLIDQNTQLLYMVNTMMNQPEQIEETYKEGVNLIEFGDEYVERTQEHARKS